MGRNAMFECANPGFTKKATENGEILLLLEKVIAIMNRGFKNIDTRLQLVEEKLDVVDRLLKQMGTDKRI